MNTALEIYQAPCIADGLEPWLTTDAIDIEREVVGAALHGVPSLDHIRAVVSPTDFSMFAHRIIFHTILEIQDAGGDPSPAAVFDKLRKTPSKNELGDRPAVYLHHLYELAGVGVNGDYYAKKLRDISIRKNLVYTLSTAVNRVSESNEPAGDVITEIEEMLFDLGDDMDDSRTREVRSLSEASKRLHDRLNEPNPKPEIRYPSGFESLDGIIGGFRPGRLCVLAARPGVGKSALALALALNSANRGDASLIFSLEMDADEIMQRALAIQSGVSLSRIIDAHRLEASDFDNIATAGSVGNVYIDDSPSLRASQLASITRMAVRRHGVKVIILDYLQLLSPENHREPRHLQVGGDTRRLKQLARQCGVPVVCLCQLNREVSDDAEPAIAQLRDSGEIEQNADVVILLWRGHEDSDGPTTTVNGKVAKQRNGMTGKFELTYRRPCVRFENRGIKW